MSIEDPLRELFGGIFGKMMLKTKYEPVAPLSKEENAEWEKVLNGVKEAESILEEAKTKKKLFWIKIERKIGVYDASLQIENGIIHKAIPNSCSGECESCKEEED